MRHDERSHAAGARPPGGRRTSSLYLAAREFRWGDATVLLGRGAKESQSFEGVCTLTLRKRRGDTVGEEKEKTAPVPSGNEGPPPPSKHELLVADEEGGLCRDRWSIKGNPLAPRSPQSLNSTLGAVEADLGR